MSKITEWHGCYDGNLKDLIVPEAFQHPAKMSRLLCERIFDYGRERGYWNLGDLILDPFGGIGTTGLIGAYRGYRVVMVELEQHFVDLAQQNIEFNLSKLNVLSNPAPIMLQGDSRQLARILTGANGALTSPPFLQSSGGQPEPQKGGAIDEALYKRHGAGNKSTPAYGQEEGQIHNLPEGDLRGVIASPPYGEGLGHGGGANEIDKSKGLYARINHNQYGSSEGQISGLPEGSIQAAITSPPYEDSDVQMTHMTSNKRGDPSDPNYRPSWKKKLGEGYAESVRPYGNSENQLGNLPEGSIQAAITSPPYEDSVNSNHSGIDWEKAGRPERNNPSNSRQAVQAGGLAFRYGDQSGQLGAESGDTYWSAVAQIYHQVFSLLPPGGAFALVLKDFVRNKARVPLCDQTAELLESIGFEIPERIHALLVKERQLGINMFTGEIETKLTEHKSFFRRLAENKGSPRIDYEEVIWAVKP